MPKVFDAECKTQSDHVHKYTINCNAQPVPYSDILNLWQHDAAFRSFFISLLSESPFKAFRWETPSISNITVNRNFEFVLLNSPRLSRTPDPQTYAEHFSNDNANGVTAFENLGRDATLIVPYPQGQDSAYVHLATFIRNAPDAQKHALWHSVGHSAQRKLGNQPMWISTAGGGVAWLHVRLDSRPKYYGHDPYRTST